jgi:hypothetical protein
MTELQGEDQGVILVALNTDPNEDEAAVLEHVEEYGLAGRFAVAPQSLTDTLVEEFGADIVSVPTAPVILVSSDQTSARLLPRGLKSVDELKTELAAGG